MDLGAFRGFVDLGAYRSCIGLRVQSVRPLGFVWAFRWFGVAQGDEDLRASRNKALKSPILFSARVWGLGFRVQGLGLNFGFEIRVLGSQSHNSLSLLSLATVSHNTHSLPGDVGGFVFRV